MKKTYTRFPVTMGTTTLIIQLLFISVCSAQIINLKRAPANVIIDGNLTEWGDSLSYFNSDTQFNYTLANDKDNLYLVLKTNDPMEQTRILSSGITWGIDTKGRKKSTYSVTFPAQEQENSNFINSNTAPDKKLQVSLTKLKKLKADGFKDVEYDLVTLENTYGFRAAINYDTHGFLVYEEVIPLALFHADELKKGEWAFDIKINGPQQAVKKEGEEQPSNSGMGGRGGGGGGGRRGGGGMGGGRGGGRGRSSDENTPNPYSAPRSIDFGGRFILANAQ